jgi:hypothetical protein
MCSPQTKINCCVEESTEDFTTKLSQGSVEEVAFECAILHWITSYLKVLR